MIHSRTVVLDQRKHIQLVIKGRITGCGRDGGLTFYLLREEVRVKEAKLSHIACGQRATTTSGWRGVLLCEDCAVVYGLKATKLKATANE